MAGWAQVKEFYRNHPWLRASVNVAASAAYVPLGVGLMTKGSLSNKAFYAGMSYAAMFAGTILLFSLTLNNHKVYTTRNNELGTSVEVVHTSSDSPALNGYDKGLFAGSSPLSIAIAFAELGSPILDAAEMSHVNDFPITRVTVSNNENIECILSDDGSLPLAAIPSHNFKQWQVTRNRHVLPEEQARPYLPGCKTVLSDIVR